MDERLIAAANYRLKQGRVGLTIEERRATLWLRGTLPPRPGSGKQKPYQQRINTGLAANPVGLKTAERVAKEHGIRLSTNTWSWSDILPPDDQLAAGDWVERYKLYYLSTRSGTAAATTWEKDYARVYRELNPRDALTAQSIENLVLATVPGSRLRERYCTALGALAKFAGVEFDSSRYRSKPRDRYLDPRELPTDDQIVAAWREIGKRSKAWAWAFGMIAAYGLRPHEVWSTSIEENKKTPEILTVYSSKTGRRTGVIPLLPEWWDLFKLGDPCPPNNQAKDVGRAASQQFRRYGIQFTPYDLRHAYAGRAARYQIEVGVAARMMGHSIKVHEQYYGHWFSSQTQADLLERIRLKH